MTHVSNRLGVTALVVLLGLGVVLVPRAHADSTFPFNYRVDATTHLKKLNQTATIKNGTFSGYIDFTNSTLHGSLTLPKATITLKEAGIGLVTATAQIVQTKPVTGTINFSQSPFQATATATFNIRVLSAYLAAVPVNLVGNSCTTATPASVTMHGAASLGGPSTFSGTYTIPPLKNCGLVQTIALNELIPGPGNTFTAVATPR